MDDAPENTRPPLWPSSGGSTSKRMAWGLGVWMAVFAVVGALLALPLSLIPIESLAIGWRLLLAAGLGAVVGSLIGFVWGGPQEFDRNVKRREQQTRRRWGTGWSEPV